MSFVAARLLPFSSEATDVSPPTFQQPIVARGDLAEDEAATIELFRRNAQCVVHVATREIDQLVGSEEISEGAGSGFIWDRKGHIVTNNHVVDDSFQIHVILPGGTVWPATLVGRAPSKDLAVLKIEAPADLLVPVQAGTSSNLQVGQKVFAIGNPFGLDRTLTTGVISALDREIDSYQVHEGTETNRKIGGVIQTDAAINPGNSGGPILDSAGQLIGVSTAIYSVSGASSGVGFAIPVDTVRRFVPELIAHGKIVRPTIGVRLSSDRTSAGANTTTDGGVLIKHVDETSAAARAGLRGTRVVIGRRGDSHVQFGDMIVQADENEIRNLNDWYSFLASRKPGDEIAITIVRGPFSTAETRKTVKVVLESPTDL
ncbi:MAG: trypsin-like peptidase domain-containing protein [Planctomycetales bacterium]|nr:trypsin-like peptidase domain-containing protein [Planctomycetales bacterium]